jgi:type I pantothenate kinase
VTGSVAVGKSTFARALQHSLMQQLRVRVAVVSSDGFLYPDHVLECAGLMDRKGFPESHDHAALADFFAGLRSAARSVTAPVYSQRRRAVIGQRLIGPLDCLIFEGVYAFQPARASGLPRCAIFLDAEPETVEAWYTARFLHLRSEPGCSQSELRARAAALFARVNRANYDAHIAPLRASADLVLRKAGDHTLTRVIHQGACAGTARSRAATGRSLQR